MPVKEATVECHSGHTYAQRPIAFWWEDERLEIEAIEAEWRSPTEKHFRVKTQQGAVYEVIYDQASDAWQIRIP